uniref:Uncharacterized protein n=1 Tax=Arundo donax TaxID=35708 RepID=A0A0A9C4H8_ARUDO
MPAYALAGGRARRRLPIRPR